MKITSSAVGITPGSHLVRDTAGSGLLAMQLEITGTATARVLGRVSPEAPWVEIREAATAGYLEVSARVPYVALEVTAYTGGAVNLYIAER